MFHGHLDYLVQIYAIGVVFYHHRLFLFKFWLVATNVINKYLNSYFPFDSWFDVDNSKSIGLLKRPLVADKSTESFIESFVPSTLWR